MGAANALATAESWLRVTALPPSPAPSNPDSYPAVVLEAETPVGNGWSTPESRSVNVLPSMVTGIAWGLAHDSGVYLALSSTGLEQELVAYTLIRPSDQASFFAGDFQNLTLTQPLIAELGDEYESALDDVIGLTDPAEILRVLADHSKPK